MAAREEGWHEDALSFVRERPFFANRQTAGESEIFFVTLHRALRESGDRNLLAAAEENLAGLWTSLGKYSDAAEIREQQYAKAAATLPYDDAQLLLARDQLAILYRNAGEPDKAAALYGNLGICAHLQPLLDELLQRRGANIVSCCRPWSDNCHIWVYVDQVIDCETLLTKHGAGGTLSLHDHRGTHDGAERGIVCSQHADGVMGKYPY